MAKGIPPEKRIAPGSGHTMRSTFVEPCSCDTVHIQGITLKNPMFWQSHPTPCRNVTIDGVRTDASGRCGQAAFTVRGLPNSHVRGLRVSECRFDGVENTTSNGRPV